MKTHCDTCKMAMEQGLCQNRYCRAFQARQELMGTSFAAGSMVAESLLDSFNSSTPDLNPSADFSGGDSGGGGASNDF